jgi:hypothetical protein
MAKAALPRSKDNGRTAFKLVFPVLAVGFMVLMSMRSQNSLLHDISAFSSPSVFGQVVNVDLQSAGEDETPPISVKNDEVCWENPYAASFHSSLESIRSQADNWLEKENMDLHLQKAALPEMKNYTWARFFPFDAMSSAECHSTCVGAACKHDDSKIVCGIEQLSKMEKLKTEQQKQSNQCVVYSMGGNNQWQFELDVLDKTPCQVHTFDCTGHIDRFRKPVHPRLTFHHTCLGAEHVPFNHDQACSNTTSIQSICGDVLTLYQIQILLGHQSIDLFKIDIEGYEWPILESWPELTDTSPTALDMVLPMQVLVEIHYKTPMAALLPPGLRGDADFKDPVDIVRLQEHLLKTGYAVASRDDNRLCLHCTELTLVRYKCHHHHQHSSRQQTQQQLRNN